MFKRLHAFHCGTEICPQSSFDPASADPNAPRRMPYSFYLIEHGDRRVLFDTGPNPAFVRDNVAYIGPGASGWKVEFNAGDDAGSQLRSMGVDPASIGHVLMSHLHYDHAGGMCLFANARFWIQEREWIYANDPPPGQVNNFVRSEFNLADAQISLIDGEYDLFGDGSLVLVPTPGHTPGHQSLRIVGAKSSYILTADAAYLSDLDDPRCIPGPAFMWNAGAMNTSRENLRAIRDRFDATVIATHDPAGERYGPTVPATFL